MSVPKHIIHQGIIIDIINKEFKKRKMPSQLILNEGGVCNGLAMVYAQYALQDKEKEFFNLLNLIASGKLNDPSITDDEAGDIYLFASQVQLAFSPSKFEQSLTQLTSMEMLYIDNKRLKSSFDFSLATSDEKWAKVIKQISLQDDEVMITQSVNHTIAIRKKNNQYHVYDPNYPRGAKVFTNEEALANELHRNVFNYNSRNLGMDVHVIRHPKNENIPRVFPDIKELYQDVKEKYQGVKKEKGKRYPNFLEAKIGEVTYNTLACAAGAIKDPGAIEILMEGASTDEKFQAAKKAVIYNNSKALPSLLKGIEENAKLSELIASALVGGKLEVFNAFEKYLANKDSIAFIPYAAHGGNPEILKKILNINKRNVFHEYIEAIKGIDKERKIEIFDLIQHSITVAIMQPDAECVKVLMREASRSNYTFSNQEKLDYLLTAIHHNNVTAVEYLIKENPGISNELLKTITMSPLAMQRTNVDILEYLRDIKEITEDNQEVRVINFPKEIDEIIKDKRDKSGNDTLLFLTKLTLFINYLQEFFKIKQLNYDINQLNKIQDKSPEEVNLDENVEVINLADFLPNDNLDDLLDDVNSEEVPEEMKPIQLTHDTSTKMKEKLAVLIKEHKSSQDVEQEDKSEQKNNTP